MNRVLIRFLLLRRNRKHSRLYEKMIDNLSESCYNTLGVRIEINITEDI